MLLTYEQQRDLARRAIWYFDCYFGEATEDSVVFTGDGVEDLNRLISRLQENAAVNHLCKQRFLVDVGAQYSDWRPFDIEDVQAVLAAYIAYWGDVNKPNVYAPGFSEGMMGNVPVNAALYQHQCYDRQSAGQCRLLSVFRRSCFAKHFSFSLELLSLNDCCPTCPVDRCCIS